MTLAPGSQLGPYAIHTQIGAGGMGEVYKAWDGRLDRWVAIKVLPRSLAQDEQMRARFEREAKAVAALSHPNILGIFDFVWDGAMAFAVMELLEGQTLGQVLREGPLPPKKAVEWAVQIARGLSAAHQKGIVHRDLKPDNVFITQDSRIKLLDFGLAKVVGRPGAEDTLVEVPSGSESRTLAGTLLGTVGYMSPEQVRGEELDHRSDIFSFGTLFYEMLSGRRPFACDTTVETLSAILRDEPGSLTGSRGPLPPGLERLVLRCLEKRPQDRFQSMEDLAFGLESPSQVMSTFHAPRRLPRPRAMGWICAGLLVLLAGLWGLGWVQLGRPGPPPTFVRLLHAPGTVESAFFGPDGRTVYFSARMMGGPPEVYVIASDSPEPRPLGIQDALLLHVGAQRELTVLKHPRRWTLGRYRGLLAQVPGGGGAEKVLKDDVEDAAWDGQGMATLTHDDQLRLRVEFPVGRTVMEDQGFSHGVKLLRLSRDGQHLAMVEGRDGRSEVVVVPRNGGRRVLYTKPGDGTSDTLSGMAWGPGDRIWVSEVQGDQTALWSIGLGGQRRLLWRGEGVKQLLDVAPDGRMLLAHHAVRRGVLVQVAGSPTARELSLRTGTQCQGLSPDGGTLLLLESPALDGGTAQDLTFLRGTDGSPALRLGRGNPYAFSLDGRWIQVNFSGLRPEDLDSATARAFQRAGLDLRAVLDPAAPQPYLCFAPAGMGEPFVLGLPPSFTVANVAFLLPEPGDIVFQAAERGQAIRYYRMPRAGGIPRPLTPEGFGHNIVGISPLSPDGNRLVVTADRKRWFLVSTEGGPLVPVRGLRPDERVLGWTSDSRALRVRPELSELPVDIERLDPATGHRQRIHRFVPPDPAGHLQTRTVYMDREGLTCAFTYDRKLSELFLVSGVR